MARSCKELICLGCGEDMTDKCSNRRSLTSTEMRFTDLENGYEEDVNR